MRWPVRHRERTRRVRTASAPFRPRRPRHPRSRPQSRRDQGTPFRSGGQPGQRFGEPGAERSGRGTNPQGGHGQRDPVPAGCAQHGGCQQGGSASHGQIRAAKDTSPGPMIPPGGRRPAMGAAGDRYTSAHADNSERREDATGLHRYQASPSRARSLATVFEEAGGDEDMQAAAALRAVSVWPVSAQPGCRASAERRFSGVNQAVGGNTS